LGEDRKHSFKNSLKGHGMAAHTSRVEEITVAVPASFLIMNSVRVVVAIKGDREFFEPDTITLLCITLGLLDLADHSMVHNSTPPYDEMDRIVAKYDMCLKRKHAGMAALRAFNRCVRSLFAVLFSYAEYMKKYRVMSTALSYGKYTISPMNDICAAIFVSFVSR
jgi:hypothetical protein